MVDPVEEKENNEFLNKNLVGDFKLIIDENNENNETDEASANDAKSPLRVNLKPKLIWPKKYRVWHTPWFIVCMCLLQLFFFFIGNDCVYQRLLFTPEHHGNQLWRYLTYTLLHSDLIQLMLNVCILCMVGLILECEQGHWRVAFIYAAGGFSGSLATAILQPQLSLLGASAAIYALLMSHIPHLVKNFPHLPRRFFRIVTLIVLCLSDVAFTLFHFLVNHNLNPRICVEAHIAGAVAGLSLSFLIYRRLQPEGVK